MHHQRSRSTKQDLRQDIHEQRRSDRLHHQTTQCTDNGSATTQERAPKPRQISVHLCTTTKFTTTVHYRLRPQRQDPHPQPYQTTENLASKRSLDPRRRQDSNTNISTSRQDLFHHRQRNRDVALLQEYIKAKSLNTSTIHFKNKKKI